MTIIRGAHLETGATLATDVCVIGSGAAGITIARQLERAGRDVVVLEAGAMSRDVAVEQDTFAIEQIGVPHRNPIPDRGRYYGGSTNLWFGRIALLDRIDFAVRPWVRWSGWPIDLAHLMPYVELAGEVLAVPHFDKISIDTWPTNPTIDTFGSESGGQLRPFLWADAWDMGATARQSIERSSNVRLVLDGTVTELACERSASSVSSVLARSRSGSFRVHASAYVLAAGGLENPRLLLASTDRHPSGVGNQYDNVGRYYLDHPRGEGLARVDLRGLDAAQVQRLALLGERADSPYGKAQLRLTFPEQMQRNEELLNHSLHGHFVSELHGTEGYRAFKRLRTKSRTHGRRLDREVARDLMTVLRSSPKLASLGIDRHRASHLPNELVVVDQMEQPPDPSSRVIVLPRNRDQFGLPRLQLDWRIDDATYRSQRRMHEMFRELLGRAGITTFHSDVLDDPGCRPALWDMKHPSGTTRMSASPRSGVVDANCRVHGMDNLYVAGSSVFPTVGNANPTLMIVALAARLADHLRTLQ